MVVLVYNLSYEFVLTIQLTDEEQVPADIEETIMVYNLEHLGLTTLHLLVIWGI